MGTLQCFITATVGHIVIFLPRLVRVDLPADGPVLHCLPQVQSTAADDGAADNMDPQEGLMSFVPDSLSEEHNMFLPDFHPRLYEVNAIQIGIQQIGIKTTPSNPVPWPAFGPPLSEYSTDGLFSMAFPSLFPLGNADYFTP